MKHRSLQWKKALILSMAAASLFTAGAYGATSHWADASLTPAAVTRTAAGDSTDWNTWKQSWEQIQKQP